MTNKEVPDIIDRLMRSCIESVFSETRSPEHRGSVMCASAISAYVKSQDLTKDQAIALAAGMGVWMGKRWASMEDAERAIFDLP